MYSRSLVETNINEDRISLDRVAYIRHKLRLLPYARWFRFMLTSGIGYHLVVVYLQALEYLVV